jgi:hypothetical protein
LNCWLVGQGKENWFQQKKLLSALLVLCIPSQVCVFIGLLAGGSRWVQNKRIAGSPAGAVQTQLSVRVDWTAGWWFQETIIGFRKEIAECPDDAEQTQPGVRVDCTAGLWFQNKKIAECLAEAVET